MLKRVALANLAGKFFDIYHLKHFSFKYFETLITFVRIIINI